MKTKKLALLAALSMSGISPLVYADISMNIGVTSNYVWRAMTQTENSSAISGGLDWNNAQGFYAGAWVSQAWSDYELDLYGGYSGTIGDFGYGAGLIYYTYPGDDDANFVELGLSGSWHMLNFGLDYTLDSDIDDTSALGESYIEGDMHYYAGVSLSLPQDFSLALTFGQYAWEDDGLPTGSGGVVEDFTYYQIDLTKNMGAFGDVTLSLSDSDIKDVDPDAGGNDSDMRVFVSWAKSL